MTTDSVLDKNYHIQRREKRALKYRYRRRADEVADVIRRYLDENGYNERGEKGGEPLRQLDVGSADGLMLSRLKDIFPAVSMIGLEYSQELIEENGDRRFTILQGDAHRMGFPDDTFDIVSACAIIEHLHAPDTFMQECHRALKKNGLLIVTTPVPFWEEVFTKLGHLADDLHHTTFNLEALNRIFERNGFEIRKSEKFMLSPWGVPFEKGLERVLKALGITFTLGNQVVVGRK